MTPVKSDIELKPLALSHKEDLFALVDHNRSYLRKWLPWLDNNLSAEDTGRFLLGIVAQNERGDGPQYAIYYRSILCGVCGFHEIERAAGIGRIGYWLGEKYCGRGIVTCAVARLLGVGFDQYQLSKVEIRCALENWKSRSVPERLGFYLEDIKPNAEYLYDHYVDHAVYSLLRPEYEVQKTEDQ